MGFFHRIGKKIADAYGIKYYKAETLSDLNKTLSTAIDSNKSVIYEVICPPDEKIYPTLAAKQMPNGGFESQPLENMSPFLSEEELREEMIIRRHNEK